MKNKEHIEILNNMPIEQCMEANPRHAIKILDSKNMTPTIDMLNRLLDSKAINDKNNSYEKQTLEIAKRLVQKGLIYCRLVNINIYYWHRILLIIK